MSFRDNKILVLRKLDLESEPISLPSLVARLGAGFKERSVRRWVSLLVREGAIKKIGQKRGSKYIAVRRSQEINDTIGSCFSSASLKAIKAMGFDEIRVRYRQERRALISKIILQKIVGNNLETYVVEEAGKLVPVTARHEFIKDVLEDLTEMDESRLAGLGVSPDQLELWNRLRHKP